ncbi:MAG: hypothetical protein J0M19_06015 [Sphingomonadales bacterium]|nr:hypothetical protein [Sphingomonadales bacterium]
MPDSDVTAKWFEGGRHRQRFGSLQQAVFGAALKFGAGGQVGLGPDNGLRRGWRGANGGGDSGT